MLSDERLAEIKLLVERQPCSTSGYEDLLLIATMDLLAEIERLRGELVKK